MSAVEDGRAGLPLREAQHPPRGERGSRTSRVFACTILVICAAATTVAVADKTKKPRASAEEILAWIIETFEVVEGKYDLRPTTHVSTVQRINGHPKDCVLIVTEDSTMTDMHTRHGREEINYTQTEERSTEIHVGYLDPDSIFASDNKGQPMVPWQIADKTKGFHATYHKVVTWHDRDPEDEGVKPDGVQAGSLIVNSAEDAARLAHALHDAAVQCPGNKKKPRKDLY